MESPRVLFAITDPGERRAFADIMARDMGASRVFFPDGLADVERMHAGDAVDVLVTDFRFHGGALADWLTLWPMPAVLVVDPSDSSERIESTVKDESAVLIERRADGGHLLRLPLLIRKVLNIRESVRRQNTHLQITERQYLNLLQAIPDIVYFLDREGRFVYLNEAVRSLGLEPARLIGRHFSEILEPGEVERVSRERVLEELRGLATGDEAAPKLFDERRSGPRMTRNLELRLKRPPGAEFEFGSVIAYGELSSTGFESPEFAGKGTGTVGIIRDITHRKLHEKELEALVAAREVLLREIHHRVKNNLQLVSSLLNLQEHAIEGEAERMVFTQVETQVHAMALVHELLYRSETFEKVDLQRFFERLAAHLREVHECERRGLGIQVDAAGAELELDLAIPVALLANELLANSLHHAFPAGEGGRLSLTMRLEGEEWRLAVEDDGIGVEAGRRGGEGPGIGTELVSAVASQLRGCVETGTPPGGSAARPGFRTLFRFPSPR